MLHWIFIVIEHKCDGGVLSTREIFNTRMNDRFWGLGERTPNRNSLQEGDRVVFYLGLPEKVFAGTATLASSSFGLSNEQRKNYGHGIDFFTTNYGVLLSEIEIWDTPKAVEGLVPQLAFIENKKYWYSYFQGGVRQVPERDFGRIVGAREATLVEQIAASKDIEDQTEFALESHLEEFIFNNWAHINWGSNLRLHEIDEQNGRQFPAGQWSIDFLAHDDDTDDLVVIELKRGKTSDSAVGQLQRYIGWVRENIAKEGQNVRGMIVAREVDEALQYAVMPVAAFVQVRLYKVDFELRSFTG